MTNRKRYDDLVEGLEESLRMDYAYLVKRLNFPMLRNTVTLSLGKLSTCYSSAVFYYDDDGAIRSTKIPDLPVRDLCIIVDALTKMWKEVSAYSNLEKTLKSI